MKTAEKSGLLKENEELRNRLDEAESTLEAIRKGEVDALVVIGPEGEQVFTLKGAEYTYRVIVETMDEGAAAVTSEGDIFYCNRRLTELLQTPAGKITGSPFIDFVAPENRETFSGLFSRALAGASRGELILQRATAAGIPAYVAMNAIELEETGVCIVVTDLSDQKTQEEILARARRLADIGTLAATVAHELRNPLAAIGMAAANIERKSAGLPIERQLKTVNKKIAESDQIIDNLLFYSRLKSPHFEILDLSEKLSETLGEVRKQFKKDLSLLKKLGPIKGLTVEADPLQVSELFTNILNNAYDALPETGGIISVSAATVEKDVRVCFRDNGAGIEKSIIKKIQDPFFSTKAKGTGLGLSVCSQIVGLHGGNLSIESKPGKGTSVTITIPGRQKP